MKLFLTLAVRNFFKKPVFTTLNLVGLSIGFISFFFIAEYIIFETSYDKFHVDADKIYRVGFDWGEIDQDGANTSIYASNVPIIGPLLEQEIPEITYYTRLFDVKIARPFSVFTYQEGGTINYSANEEKGFYADSSFFDVFSFKVLEGDPQLTEPNSLLLTESLAYKIFGDVSHDKIVGSLIEYDNMGDGNLEVTAIIEDTPANSHIQFDFLVSYMTIKSGGPHRSRWWSQFHTYVKTNQSIADGQLEEQFSETLKLLYKEESTIRIFLQPLLDIYLESNLRQEIGPTGSSRQVYFLSIIALLVLSMAWINYINLFSSRAADRANEIGIKKVMGSPRKSLIAQFFFESLFINVIALLISLFFVVLAQNGFENLIGKDLSSVMWEHAATILAVLGGLVIFSTLPSLYPALVITTKRSIDVLGSKFRASKRNLIFQKTLIYFQFIISFLIIASTMVIGRQINFMQSQDRGMSLTNRISIKSPGNVDDTYSQKSSVFVNRLKGNADIANASFSSSVPGQPITVSGGIHVVGATKIKGNNIFKINVDENFIGTYEIRLIEGRDFSSSFSQEEQSVIINEAALSLLGFTSPEEAISKKVSFAKRELSIVGVIANYNHLSLKESFEPLLLSYDPSPFGFVTLQIIGTDYANSLTNVQNIYDEIYPSNPFEYELSDAIFNKQYGEVEVFSVLVKIFSLVAIIISGMGLLALSAFKVQKHMKEIAIRKVFGADASNILLRLFKSFGIEAVVSSLIGGFIAFYVMSSWLENFAFAIDMRALDFIIPLIALIFVIAASISYNCFKAITINPSESLKDE